METAHDNEGVSGCESIAGWIDAYVSNQLEGDAAERVIRHTTVCAQCASAVDERLRIRAALKRAIDRGDGASDELRDRIQAMLREEAAPRANRHTWWYAAAAAALLLFGAGAWMVARIGAVSGGNSAPVIARSAQPPDAAVLQVGLAHHVHCVNMVPPPETPGTDASMQERLGPEYAGLVEAVRRQLPGELTIVDAHRCSSQNRRYLHVVARHGGDIVSILVTKRADGPLAGSDIEEGLAETAVTPASLSNGDDSVTGFETSDYYVYVVSSARSIDTSVIATAIGPSVRDFLATRT